MRFIEEFVARGPDPGPINRKFYRLIQNVQYELETLIGEQKSGLVHINQIHDDRNFKDLFEKYQVVSEFQNENAELGARLLHSRPATS